MTTNTSIQTRWSRQQIAADLADYAGEHADDYMLPEAAEVLHENLGTLLHAATGLDVHLAANGELFYPGDADVGRLLKTLDRLGNDVDIDGLLAQFESGVK